MVYSDLVDKCRYRQMGGARVPSVPVGLPLGQCASSQCGGNGIKVILAVTFEV
jgi:hypothetical protein